MNKRRCSLFVFLRCLKSSWESIFSSTFFAAVVVAGDAILPPQVENASNRISALLLLMLCYATAAAAAAWFFAWVVLPIRKRKTTYAFEASQSTFLHTTTTHSFLRISSTSSINISSTFWRTTLNVLGNLLANLWSKWVLGLVFDSYSWTNFSSAGPPISSYHMFSMPPRLHC